MTTNGGDRDSDRVEWLAGTILRAAEAAGIGVTVTMAEGELRNVYASKAIERMLGYSAEQLLEADPLSVLGGAASRLSEHVDAFLSGGSFPPTLETAATRADGRHVFLEFGLGGMIADGKPGVVSFVADVTERKLAIESLKKSEQRFRSVVETIPEPIFITDGTTLTYANPAFVSLVGAEPSRAVSVLDLLPPADLPRLREKLAACREEAVNAEFEMKAHDGRMVALEFSMVGVEHDGRSSVLWLGQDITARKRLESQILQADRLAVLGTLAGGMAHAINNPLSYTLLNLEHVSRRMRDLATEHEYYAEARVRLAEAHDGADRVAKVVRQMRALSRARPLAPGPMDVRAVLESVLAMIGNEIRYRGTLVTRYEPAPRVWASEGELEQAFLGLLLYVARSRPEETGLSREIRLVVGSDGDRFTTITVSDDGPPLDPEVRARLFDPFASAAGLGLAMCHAIFTALGGKMSVESTPGSGTTFRVVLPASDAQPDVVPAKRHSVHPLAPPVSLPSRVRVLVIDDDPGVASTLRAMLEAHHEVKSVESAREGLRLLLGNQEFDIVFCDLVMPEISGIDLYCALELNRPEGAHRIVFMTGGVFTPEAERFLARVPNLRIEKPFSLTRVEQLLAEAVQRPRTVPPQPS